MLADDVHMQPLCRYDNESWLQFDLTVLKQRPWPELENKLQIMYKVGTGMTPRIPENLSEEGKEFLSHCLLTDPEARSTASQLKDHAFVKVDFVFSAVGILCTPSSPKPINPLALLPLLGSPLKSSVLSLPAAVWNAPTSHHTQFSTLNCFGLLPTATISL